MIVAYVAMRQELASRAAAVEALEAREEAERIGRLNDRNQTPVWQQRR